MRSACTTKIKSGRSILERTSGRWTMHDIIYLVGLIVVVMFILSALGLR
jgi:hypothetical protein